MNYNKLSSLDKKTYITFLLKIKYITIYPDFKIQQNQNYH